jgi:hypothetical protein
MRYRGIGNRRLGLGTYFLILERSGDVSTRRDHAYWVSAEWLVCHEVYPILSTEFQELFLW